jgi:AraC family transcriptional regulator
VQAATALLEETECAPYELSEGLYPPGQKLKFGGDDAHFCFVLEGAIAGITAEGTVTGSAGELLFFPAGVSYVVDFAEPTHCLTVRISPAMHGRVPMALPEMVSVQNWEAAWLVKRLQTEFASHHPAREVALEAMVMQLLALTARAGGKARRDGEPWWLKRVRALLDDEYLSNHRLSDLASLAGVHRVHLAREFHKHYGMTIGQHVRQRRIAHACELLARTDSLLRDIAVTCRFVDQSHFSRQFKRLSGLTPAEYRDLVKTG